MKMLTSFAVMAVGLALSGCATTGLTSSFCSPASGLGPVRLTPAERKALAPEPKKAILKLNDYGAANCGWKP